MVSCCEQPTSVGAEILWFLAVDDQSAIGGMGVFGLRNGENRYHFVESARLI